MEANEMDVTLKLFIVLSRATRSISDRVNEDIKNYGLNPTEFAVLELLYHKGEQPIQKIGEKVLLSSGSITYVVDKLEERKLLLRKSCPKDRRVTYAVIEEQGIELMRDIFPKHKASIEKILSGLDVNEKEIMIQLLKKLGYFAQKLS